MQVKVKVTHPLSTLESLHFVPHNSNLSLAHCIGNMHMQILLFK